MKQTTNANGEKRTFASQSALRAFAPKMLSGMMRGAPTSQETKIAEKALFAVAKISQNGSVSYTINVGEAKKAVIEKFEFYSEYNLFRN